MTWRLHSPISNSNANQGVNNHFNEVEHKFKLSHIDLLEAEEMLERKQANLDDHDDRVTELYDHSLISEPEITVEHWTFSEHFWHLSEQNSL